MSIEALAKDMGVSESDVAEFAQNVIRELQRDGVDGVFLEMSESDREDMAIAYAAHAAKKVAEFHTTYITNTEVKSVFDDMVFAELKNGVVTDHAEVLRARGLL